LYIDFAVLMPIIRRKKGISKTIISFLKAQNLVRSEKSKGRLEGD
jgi:hypothetical protein